MTARLTIEQVKKEVSGTDETLISTKYKNNSTKLEFQCLEGHRYRMTWDNFKRGSRCAECSGLKKLTTEYIEKEAQRDGTILISKTYKGAHAKLIFQCQLGHRYKIKWNDFQQGHRCPSCATSGFKPNKPALLYYLEIFHRGRYYYKIGISNRTVEKRYPNSDLEKITVLAEWKYKEGKDAYGEEQRIIHSYSDYLYQGTATILKGATGNAELFTEDILQLRGEIFI